MNALLATATSVMIFMSGNGKVPDRVATLEGAFIEGTIVCVVQPSPLTDETFVGLRCAAIKRGTVGDLEYYNLRILRKGV